MSNLPVTFDERVAAGVYDMPTSVYMDLGRFHKLWHDDIRLPPSCGICHGIGWYDDNNCDQCFGWGSDWIWARTNDIAKEYLYPTNVDTGRSAIRIISLDHDLGGHDLDPHHKDAWLYRGSSPDGSGLDLIDWMIHNDRVPEDTVYVHSMNASGADRMVRTLINAHERGLISTSPKVFRAVYRHGS